MADEKHSFLTTLPGILSGLAALVTAGVGAYALIGKSREPAAPAPQASPQASFVAPAATPTPTPTPSATADGPFTATAVVDDPDGYVNVRAGPSTQSAIVATVRLSETIRTYPQQAAWWRVRTRAGTEGYIHSSRIRIVEG